MAVVIDSPHKEQDQMSNPKVSRPPKNPISPELSGEEPQQRKGQSGDPENKSDTTGATESGEEDQGAKA